MSCNITQEQLKYLVYYDCDTGLFTSLSDRGSVKIGDKIGFIGAYGYIKISLLGGQRSAHRMAYLYMTGHLPEQIDHINHNKSDNRWINLRKATALINGKNRSLNKDNKSGITGVSWVKRDNSWVAGIKVNRKSVALYFGKDFFEACCARKSANNKYGFHSNHGLSGVVNEAR